MGSIPDGVIEIFYCLNPSDRFLALGSSQPLVEISEGGKGGQCVGLTTLSPSCADCLEILGASTSSRPVQGLISKIAGDCVSHT